ncbi:hypothetical protein [Actinocrispum wychmicini]|uniref:Acetyltransferase (GNAT) family protein n=1 Tax=Actinocrispum wychmicini TaxID=1213861 RepID=A0A4R2IN70_9PSEU|nr:hypothetical protein [Actinocrispum wychmicini]TCO46494.1 hypothetical protein EV192_11973 [Actinocrispum wychmicini]
MEVRPRPVTEGDLVLFRRFAVEPGLDWGGFQEPARRFARDGYLGPDGGRLIVGVDDTATGHVGWAKRLHGGVARSTSPNRSPWSRPDSSGRA